MEQKVLLSLPLTVREKKPPTSMRLLKMGENDSTQGKFLLSAKSAELLMQRAKEWGNKFHFDWDHHAALAMQGVKAPAAAWYDLALRDDGLYADNIEWTPQGEKDVVDGSYKYLSPNIDFNGETREVTRFNNAALTNLPAGKQLEALLSISAAKPEADPTPAAKEQPTMERKALLSALGMPETTTDAELNARVAQLNQFKAQMLASTGAKSEYEAMSAMLSMKGQADKAETLQKTLEQHKLDAVTSERTALLSQAIEAGQLEPGSDLKKQLEGQPIEMVKALLSALPKKAAGEKTPPKDAPTPGTEQQAQLSQPQIAAARKSAAWFDREKPEEIEKHWKKLVQPAE